MDVPALSGAGMQRKPAAGVFHGNSNYGNL